MRMLMRLPLMGPRSGGSIDLNHVCLLKLESASTTVVFTASPTPPRRHPPHLPPPQCLPQPGPLSPQRPQPHDPLRIHQQPSPRRRQLPSEPLQPPGQRLQHAGAGRAEHGSPQPRNHRRRCQSCQFNNKCRWPAGRPSTAGASGGTPAAAADVAAAAAARLRQHSGEFQLLLCSRTGECELLCKGSGGLCTRSCLRWKC